METDADRPAERLVDVTYKDGTMDTFHKVTKIDYSSYGNIYAIHHGANEVTWISREVVAKVRHYNR